MRDPNVIRDGQYIAAGLRFFSIMDPKNANLYDPVADVIEALLERVKELEIELEKGRL